MKLYKGLPIYQIEVSDEYDTDDELGVSCVSFVDSPAVESDFLTFEKEDEKKKQLMFIKPKEGIVSGVAIRANHPIYRYDEKGGYYVVFGKEQIKEIVKKFSKNQRFNSTSLQHNGEPLKNVYLVEMYIKDWSRGINPKEFEDIEDGSLFMSYKIDDMDLWNEIETSGNINGFSIEIMSYLNVIDNDADEFSKEEEPEQPKDELEEFVNNIFIEEDNKKKIEEIEFVSEQKINSLKKGDTKVNITIDGETQVAQLDDIYKMNGNKYLAYYIWDADGVNGKWQFMPLVDIDNIVANDIPKESLSELKQKPSWKGIQEIIDDTTEKRIDNNDYVSLIDEGIWVTINYFNPPDGKFTTARQTAILAYGLTKKGYPCLRIYEKFGASKSVAEGEEGAVIPDYRLLRIDRIINLRPMPYMEHCTDEEIDSWGRYNWNPNEDGSMMTVFHNRTKKH